MDKAEAKKIMDCPMLENDAEAKTIGDYLGKLLTTLLEEDEGFSGKRPFGNSGWFYELSYNLALNNFIYYEVWDKLSFNPEYPYEHFKSVNHKQAETLLIEAVEVYFS